MKSPPPDFRDSQCFQRAIETELIVQRARRCATVAISQASERLLPIGARTIETLRNGGSGLLLGPLLTARGWVRRARENRCASSKSRAIPASAGVPTVARRTLDLLLASRGHALRAGVALSASRRLRALQRGDSNTPQALKLTKPARFFARARPIKRSRRAASLRLPAWISWSQRFRSCDAGSISLHKADSRLARSAELRTMRRSSWRRSKPLDSEPLRQPLRRSPP